MRCIINYYNNSYYGINRTLVDLIFRLLSVLEALSYRNRQTIRNLNSINLFYTEVKLMQHLLRVLVKIS
jgi:hypothetical protein